MRSLFLTLLMAFNTFICFAETDVLKIGAKIHFEEESGQDYVGTKQINLITRRIIKEVMEIKADDCAENAKIFLKKENKEVKITHYEEKSKPGIGEELHATLLYTKPRGYCESETFQQVYPALFFTAYQPTLEQVAEKYSKIIQPEWKFQISEIVLVDNKEGPSCIIAKLLFRKNPNIFVDDKPISAGLHMTLANFVDKSIFVDNEVLPELMKRLNSEFKGRQIKIANKVGLPDLEFGVSGSTLRIRAGEIIEY